MGLVASIDDVLRIKRRYRFILPAIASLPLLVMYYSTIGNTYVEVPWIFWYRWEPYVRLGVYFLYVLSVSLFCIPLNSHHCILLSFKYIVSIRTFTVFPSAVVVF